MQIKLFDKSLLILFFYFFAFAFSATANAATYYIDYLSGKDSNNGTSSSTPWKQCPGMNGFAGTYSHSAGDVFVFKGGVTWPSSSLPLTIANSGSCSACNLSSDTSTCDKYTIDKTWYSGSSWTRPTFDGGHTASGIYAGIGKAQYIIIDNIKIVNLEACNTTKCNSVAAIVLVEPHYAEIKNMYIDSGSKIGIQLADAANDNKSTILIHDNYIANCFKQLFFDGSGRTGTIENLQIYNNHFAGNNVLAGNESHANVIHIFGGVTTSPFPFTDLKINNNIIDGYYPYGFTAFIYIERAADGVDIYNNVLNFDNTTNETCGNSNICNGIEFWSGDNVKVYNNTISSIGTNAGGYTGISWGYVNVTAPANITIKGNIFYNLLTGISCSGAKYCTVDYNLIYPRSGGYYGENISGTKRSSWSLWQSDGNDKHGLNSNPVFINALASPFNINIQSSSPAIDAFLLSAAPSSIFTTDVLNNSRSVGAAWDIGAYEYEPSNQTTSTSTVIPEVTDNSGDGGSGGVKCFIATAAYDSYLDPHVKSLRNFRDTYLLSNSAGRIFVEFYYKYSPHFATYITNHEPIKWTIRFFLSPIVFLIEYPYVSIILLILPISFILLVHRKKTLRITQ